MLISELLPMNCVRISSPALPPGAAAFLVHKTCSIDDSSLTLFTLLVLPLCSEIVKSPHK